ncbi:photoreceptor cilium actin regulator [Erinaceus europaeus]|uniref:Photoreceptor cilium actin regulator n=1 Tax=Erinaceus europaeus TaxID=9365 RepID=A0A1S2ZSP5_ERIEU|nr:photoreceptor cilium actin regulator [Erinaceus europaeus]
MGCAPSHSDIACSVAKSGIQFFKRPCRALLWGPQGPGDGCTLPQLVQSSTCYEPPGQGWAQRQRLAEEQSSSHWVQTEAETQLLRETSADRQKGPEGLTLSLQTPEASPSHMAKDQTEQREDSGARGPCTGGQEAGSLSAHQATLPSPGPEGKVDFPEPLVRAHQRTYAFLHSSLARYEAVLRATHQAARTQELLQPMLGLLLVCFQEANQLLGEIAAEGDTLLRDVRGDLAWPPRGKGEPPEQPDLLQQLLQHTVCRLRALGGTVSSVSGGLLDGSGGSLHAAAHQMGAVLSTQRGLEKRIVGALGQLEGLAGGHGEPREPGAPLCSEDSGISADCELVDKPGQQASGDSEAEPTGGDQGLSPTLGAGCQRPPWMGTHRTQECPLTKPSTAKVKPATQARAGSPGPCSGSTPERTPSQAGGPSQSPQWTPPRREISAEMHLSKGSQWVDELSLSTGEKSNPDGEEDEAGDLSHYMWLGDTGRPRPRTSPGSSESMFQPHAGRLGNPQAQEMILKVKEAISKKIKFVPLPAGPQEWTEDERPSEVPPRPRTVSGGRRDTPKPWRSLSDTCLQGSGGEPSLQKLQEVQRELGLRLEAPHTLSSQRQGQSPEQAPRAASLMLDKVGGTPSTPIRRLKASLTKNFSILPSPDKSILLKCSPCSQKTGGLPQANFSSEEARAKHRDSQDPPTRTSVRKLIETFSPTPTVRTPGDCRKDSGPSLRKWGVPGVPPRFPIYRGLAPLYPKPQVSPAGRGLLREDLDWRPLTHLFPPLPTARVPGGEDLDTELEDDPGVLPPPPPEVLMDTSFTCLGPPESSEVAVPMPQGTLMVELGGISPSQTLWASLNPRVPVSSTVQLPSRTTATPIKPRASSSGGSRGPCHPGRPPLNPQHPTTASKSPEVQGSQAQGDRAVNLPKQARWAAPWHHASHTSGPDRPSEPSPARLLQGPPSPKASKKNPERNPPRGRKASPTRTSGTPRVDKRPQGLTSSPGSAQPTVCSVQASPSPPLSPLLNPPTTKKPGSPLPLPRLSSPPTGHQVSSPPAQHPEASSPSSGPSPSPPVSPTQGCKEARDSAEGEATPANASGNTRSIFCRATASLFEARLPFSTPSLPPEAGGTRGSPPGCWRSSSSGSPLRKGSQLGGPLRALNPQPFVRQTASDRRPRVRLPPPSCSACSHTWECPRAQGSSSEDTPKEPESWSSPETPELKGGGRGASPPELCVLGRALQ